MDRGPHCRPGAAGCWRKKERETERNRFGLHPLDCTVQAVLLAVQLEMDWRGSAACRERLQEGALLHVGSAASHGGCVAADGRAEMHAGGVAGKGVAGGQERDRCRAGTGASWMMTWRSGVKSGFLLFNDFAFARCGVGMANCLGEGESGDGWIDRSAFAFCI